MKTLKRTLGLVLALVLIVSLFAVGASAAATKLTDMDKVQYPVPVAVMNGAGIINGYPDGTFKATKGVTRAEAAKMICYSVLGQAAADRLVCTAQHFKDVPVTHWAAAYIDYCVKYGIVAGYGNGNFGPENGVTGVQIAAMAMRTVGYGQNGEFNGVQWAAGTQSAAQKFGVFAGTKAADVKLAATREETALYLYNAFTGIQEVKYVDGVKVYEPVFTYPSGGSNNGIPSFILDVWTVNGKVVANEATVDTAYSLGQTKIINATSTNITPVGDVNTHPTISPDWLLPSTSTTVTNVGGVIKSASTLDYIGHVVSFYYCNGAAAAVFDQATNAKTFVSTGNFAADAKAAGFTAIGGSYLNTTTSTQFPNYVYGAISSVADYVRTAGLKVTLVGNYNTTVDSVICSYEWLYQIDSIVTDRNGKVTVVADGTTFTTADTYVANTGIGSASYKAAIAEIAAKYKVGDIVLLSQVGDYWTVSAPKTVAGSVKTWTTNNNSTMASTGDAYVRLDMVDGNSYYYYYNNYNRNMTGYNWATWIANSNPIDKFINNVTLYLDSTGNVIGINLVAPVETSYYFVTTYKLPAFAQSAYGHYYTTTTYWTQLVDMTGKLVNIQVEAAEYEVLTEDAAGTSWDKWVMTTGNTSDFETYLADHNNASKLFNDSDEIIAAPYGKIVDVFSYTEKEVTYGKFDANANNLEFNAGDNHEFFFLNDRNAKGINLDGKYYWFASDLEMIYVFGIDNEYDAIEANVTTLVKKGFQTLSSAQNFTLVFNAKGEISDIIVESPTVNVAGTCYFADVIPELYDGLNQFAYYDAYCDGKVVTLKIKNGEIGDFYEKFWNNYSVDADGFAHWTGVDSDLIPASFSGGVIQSINNGLYAGQFTFGNIPNPSTFTALDFSKATQVDLRAPATDMTKPVDGSAYGDPIMVGTQVAIQYAADGSVAYVYLTGFVPQV